MSGLFGGGQQQKVSSAAPVVSGLRMQTSARGRPIPLVYGKTRVAANVIWYGDFRAIEHRSQQSAGGKGGGGGGGNIESVSYSYQTALQLGLCEGPVRAITHAWVGKKAGDLASWNLSQFLGGAEQQPMPYLLSKSEHADKALPYRGTAYVGTGLLELGDDPSLPNMSFEVDSRFGISDSVRDANPRDVLADLLTDPSHGLGAAAGQLGDLSRLRDWCLAAGLLVSPAYTEQQPARELLARLLQIAAAGVYCSEGKIKAVPLADSPASGNGITYSPALAPAYDLTDDDFLPGGDGDPVQCQRVAVADVTNCVRVRFVNRDTGYNDDTVEAKDPGAIERHGLRLQELDLREIADPAVARLVAQLVLQRGYVRNRYQFRLGWKYALLEPTDLVTLTDAALGLHRALVRITEIDEDEDGALTVRAEEVPVGTVTATRYPVQHSDGYAVNHNAAPGAANRPVLFEPPLALAGAPEIWIATSGSGENWGGCDVWVSDDNATYQRIGRISGKSRHGVLAAPLPASVGVDAANLLRVDVSAAGGVLLPATQQNADELVSLCYVDGELLAYRDATLTAPGRYELGYLVRGAHGTPIAAHATGSAFARLDQTITKFGYDKAKVGKTLYIKLQSFNIYGSGMESLADLVAYPYLVKGAPLADVTGLALEQPFTGLSCKVKWNAVDGAIGYAVEVWAGSPQTLRRAVSVGDARRYEYGWEDATADGGPWRQVSIRVRAISQTGASGNWATVVGNNPVPPALTGISVNAGYNAVFFACGQPADPDAAGMRLWLSPVSGFAPSDATLVYDGPNYTATLYQLRDGTPLAAGTAYYLKAAAFDAFGKDGLNISSEYAVTPVSVAGGIKPGEIEATMVKAVEAAKVVGTLKDWQLEGMAASKVQGQLQDSQLGALSADKLLGQVKLTQLTGEVQGQLSSAISTANQALAKANESASATSVQQLTARLAPGGDIDGAIAGKAPQAALDSAVQRIGSAEVALSGKAAASEVATLTAKVAAAETNLLPLQLWKPGLKSLPAPWVGNTTHTDEQELISAAGPNGDVTTVLKAVGQGGEADGGWDILIPIDRSKAYRFVAWVRHISGSGSVYLGCDAVEDRSGALRPNPYFLVYPKANLQAGRWYLLVGYVYPAGGAFPTNNQSGIFDAGTGALLVSGEDFRWAPDAVQSNPRCYQYYASEGAEQWFALPRFEAIDGREPSLQALMSGALRDQAAAALSRVSAVEAALPGKAAVSDLAALQARVTTAESGISAANQARVDGDAANATSINNVNARLASGGDIKTAIDGKAAQTSLDAAVTRITAAEVAIGGKAAASDVTTLSAKVDGSRKSVFVPGDRGTFYPVRVFVEETGGADLLQLRVDRPSVHADESWLGAYSTNVVARGSAWGNAPGQLFEVTQLVGGGNYGWGLGRVETGLYDRGVLLWLRGGMTHYITLQGRPVELGVQMPNAQGVLVEMAGLPSERYWQPLAGESQPLAPWLGKTYRPGAPVSKDSVESLPETIAAVDATITRVSNVEAALPGKASATDVTTLTARVGSAEANVTQLQSAQASLDGKVSSKWGVVLGATTPDGRQTLAGVQAFNDGHIAQFVITADQLLVQSPGSALNADPNFADRSAWQTYSGAWQSVTLNDGAVGITALRSDIKAEVIGARALPFDPQKTYRVHGWARGVGGANGSLYLGVQLLDGNGQNIGGNGSFWYTSISSVGAGWTEFNGTIGPCAVLASPAHARTFRPLALVNYGGTTGYMELQDLRVEEVLPSTLIQDGAITTDKVAANSVKARHVDTADLLANSAIIGQLTADQAFINQARTNILQADVVKSSHIDSRNLTIKDASGNVIFGAGQNLDVGRVAGLGALATKHQVAAADMAVSQLSAISANIGVINAGIMYSNDWTRYFNLDPSRSPAMMYVPGAVQINFDGSGYFNRTIVSAPDVRASGTAGVNSGWLGGSGAWTCYIDTGIDLPVGWSTASSDMFQASATIAGGQSQNGGANGYASVDVVIGDGLLSGAANSPIDNRMYIKFTWNGAGTSGGSILITSVAWKLVRV